METYGIAIDDNLLAVMNPMTGVSTPIQFEENLLPVYIAHDLRTKLKGCDIRVVKLTLGEGKGFEGYHDNPYKEKGGY